MDKNSSSNNDNDACLGENEEGIHGKRGGAYGDGGGGVDPRTGNVLPSYIGGKREHKHGHVNNRSSGSSSSEWGDELGMENVGERIISAQAEMDQVSVMKDRFKDFVNILFVLRLFGS